MEMSFAGYTGQIMSDSGLQEALETVYADNAVSHILTGKAIARAVRGHGLVDMAPQSLLCTKVFDINLCENKIEKHESAGTVMNNNIPVQNNDNFNPEGDDSEQQASGGNPCVPADKTEGHDGDGRKPLCRQIHSHQSREIDGDIPCALQIFNKLLIGELDVDTACSAPAVSRINERLSTLCKSLQKGRTAKLWLQYMEMVQILRTFIKAERTGDWKLHLQAVLDMLPFFAAAGHNLYVKSAYIYLMHMQDLEANNHEIHNFFIKSYHVIAFGEDCPLTWSSGRC